MPPAKASLFKLEAIHAYDCACVCVCLTTPMVLQHVHAGQLHIFSTKGKNPSSFPSEYLKYI